MIKKYTFENFIFRQFTRTLICVAIGFLWFYTQEGNAQTVQFKQLNFDYDGTVYSNSDWGAVDLTFTGSASLLYLNLSVDTAFAIENMPVQTLGNIGVLQTQRFWFRISSDGVPIPGVSYGYTLTPAPAGRPPLSSVATVLPDFVIIQSGATTGGGGNNHPPPAGKQKGGVPVKPPQQHKNFPNQEAGVNECVPVGISNSLQFLNTKNGLGMKAADIGIAGLKGGTNWGPGGCPRPGWVQSKKNYVKSKKLPITTRKLSGPGNIKNIGAEIAAGQDVEMDIKWKGPGAHCVCVTGWIDLGNGKYKITITHDSKQGQPGGTVSETATYDSNTGKWDGALVNGTSDFFFVVECPVVNLKQVTPPTVPSGNGYKDKTNGGSVYTPGTLLKNLAISNINLTNPLPALGSSLDVSYVGTCDADYSTDDGLTFIHLSGPANITQSITHQLDSAGVEYYPGELLSLNFGGGPVAIRESPTLPSTGLMRVKVIPGGYMIDSFFDVFTELSVDGGASWIPSSSGSSLLELNTQSVSIRQLNFNYGGTLTNFSDWGVFDLTFPGSADLLYLNLTANGVWVIQNMPVQSLDATDLLQTQRFWFPIGPIGLPVELIQFGYTLTPSILGMPDPVGNALVSQDQIIIFSGDLVIGPGDNHPPPAVIQIGGAAVQPARVAKGFPNQEAGVNECVPVGISNSLQYLNNKNGLGMKAADIGIPGLKGGTGWGPGGCPRPGWVENKKNYVKNKKLPITTRKLPGPANIKNIGAELAAGQDVEMDIKWKGPGAHCVCVTGWVDLGNGKYKITITHDSKQGQAGGCVSETATYDSNTGKWSGALVNGTNDFFFVVECPTTTINQSTPTVPSGSSINYKPNSGSLYSQGKYQLQNLLLSNFSQTIPPPPIGATQFLSYQCFTSLDFSADTGVVFTPWTGMANVLERVTRLPDSVGNMYIQIELMSLNLAGPPLPGGVMLRESPTLQSTGKSTLSPVTGGYMIDSFFDVFLDLSTDGGVSWIPQDEPTAPGSTLLEVTGPAIPAIREVQNVSVGDGQYNCLDATQTLIIAGNGTTYHVGNGGNVTMIAGQNILYYPGTTIDLGGYLLGTITSNGQYCSSMSSPMVINPALGTGDSWVLHDVTSNNLFRIYPNPTSGNFTLEMAATTGFASVNIEIYSMKGEKIVTQDLPGSGKHELSLTGNPAGIYFIRVIAGGTAETAKIIKR